MNKYILLQFFCFHLCTQAESSKVFLIPNSSTKIIMSKGDILKSKVDVIVNAANEKLAGGSGVCGAIFKAAGWDKLQDACNVYPKNKNGVRCPVGQAKITDSFGLKSLGIKYIVHAVGPDCRIITDAAQQNELLKNAYINSLHLIKTLPVSSIAFPFISSAIYECPKKQAALVAVKSVYDYIQNNLQTSLKSIHFVLFSEEDFDLFCSVATQIIKQPVVNQMSKPVELSVFQKLIQKLKEYLNWM